MIGKNPSPEGGTWAYVLVGPDGEEIARDSGLVRPSDFPPLLWISNNLTELLAITKALYALPMGWKGEVRSDSKVAVTVFRGWQGKAKQHTPKWVPATLAVSARVALETRTPRFTLLDGHPSAAQLAAGVGKRGNPVCKWNVLADRLCGEAKPAPMASSAYGKADINVFRGR
ncbi:MAG: hypothetical protein K2X82_08410 [Gemmataceae bacterium]|nr:hypothetical protein [Gemmataceae bacterium]